MSVYTDKKTGRLFVQFMFQGETYKRRLPEGSTKVDAEKLETKLKHDLFFNNTSTPAEGPKVLWETFVDKVYLEYVAANHCQMSLDRAIAICRDSMRFFRGRPVDSIKPADVERFKASRMALPTPSGLPRKPSTIHREMSIISRVFSLAVRNDLCPYNPCSRVDLPKFDNIQDRILPDADVTVFLNAFRNSLQRDICTVVLYSGLRQNDVLGLTKDKVDWDAGKIVLIQGKTRRRVLIPMHPLVVEILARRLSGDSELFFPSYRSGQKLTSIKNAIKFACKRAGIPPLGIRDLRRTFGTQLHENGFDDKTVADCLGHSDLRSVHRYKRGTRIQKEAILSLEYKVNSAKLPTSPENGLPTADANASETLVEMRGVEPLTSALRTRWSSLPVH